MSEENIERYIRQRNIVPQDLLNSQQIAIIGVGAVGKEVLRTLACNGAQNMTIYDFDTVELHNCTTQGYYESDVGRPKVEAAAEDALRINSSIKINAINDRWRPNEDKYDATFLCVDSLPMRGKLFNFFASSVGFIADARLGGEQIRIVTAVDDASRAHYPTTLAKDEDAHADGCHVPMVKHAATIAASMLVSRYMNWLRGFPAIADTYFALPTTEITVLKD